jgi:hypothetical protein
MTFLSTILSLVLTPLLVVLPVQAEMGASVPVSTTTAGQPAALQIRLADAGRAIVEANTFVKGYAILVTDSSGLPVAGAAVAIRLPEDGATGFFTDGAKSAVAYTDASGTARFDQVNWGPTLGIVSIRVTAVKGDVHAGALLEQTIVARLAASTSAPKAEATIVPWGQSESTTAEARPKPGTPISVHSVSSGGSPEKVPLPSTPTAASTVPNVSIVTTSGSKGGLGSSKKWLILAAVAVGAGAGIALALASKGGVAAVASSTPSLSIGTPTVSVGH